MRSNNLTLGAILNSPNQYIIPVFQRYYRWDQPEWEKLWADLLELQQPGKTGKHFLGFLVLVPETVMPGQINKYHLIDGQQRLTTLSLVLCALRDAAAAGGHQELAQEVGFTTLEHQFKRGGDRYRLSPKLRDRDQYVAYLAGEAPAEGRIAAAVRYFSGRLTTIPGAGTEAGLRAFFDLLTQRLEFIFAQLENENPFNIFKSLNSTGIPLGQSDLIRNFIFMQVPVGDQEEFDEALWKATERRFENTKGNIDELAFSAFLRDYLMQNGRYVSPGETFEAFQRHYEATEFDPKHVAADLKQASEWYATLQGQRPDPNPEVETALETLRQLDSSTTLSLLLNLYHRRHRGQLSDPALTEALRLLSGFILRRLICGEGSRAYARMFVQAIPALGHDAVGGLREFLESRGFPDTPRFAEAFARFNLYASRYRKAVLVALERAYEHKEPVVLENAQVEHIMPQTLSESWRAALGPEYERIHSTWLHTPGNLTLTGYNAELSNKPFVAKREEYKTSNIVMTRELAQHETWGESDVEARGRAMAEVAARVWPGPAQPVRNDEDRNRGRTSWAKLRRRFWDGFQGFIESSSSTLTLRTPQDSNTLRCGRLGNGIHMDAYVSEKMIILAVSFREEEQSVFRSLGEHEQAIEAEIGMKLQWGWGEHLAISYVNEADVTDVSLWPTYYDWMRRSLESFQRVLGPRIVRKEDGEEAGGEIPTDPKGELTKTETLGLEYWTAFRSHLIEAGSDKRPQKPAPKTWTSFALGRSCFALSPSFIVAKREIGVWFVLSGPLAKGHFRSLTHDRETIEAEIGSELEWQELPDKKRSYVVLRRSADPTDRQDWPAQHAWLRETLETFHTVFSPRVKELKAESPASDEEATT